MDDPRKQMRHLAAAIFVAAMTFGATTASAGPPIESVDILEQRVDHLEDTFLVPAVLESRFRLATRFNEAKVAYLLEDYNRASILFVSVIESAEVRQFDSYREALYLLGDSLYLQRSFRAGREYFRRVVELGPGPYYQASIVKLLEIAGEIHDYDEVDDLYDRLDDLENVSAAIHYTRGKTLYEEGRIRSARPWFQRAARDAQYAFTARYFEGVTLAAMGELAEAEQIFVELTRQTATNSEDAQVKELAHLALGRLAYERENYPEAIDHYLQLPRTSVHFDRALYELTWALVAEENYRAALRNLDILLISDPDPRFIPEAKSLMADMAMRLQEYDDARRWFDELVQTFTPVRQELQRFIDEHEELDQFFIGLVRDDLEGLRPEYLPEEVTQWVEDEQLMKVSRQLVSDGMMTQGDIDSAYDSIEEIEGAIDMGSSIEAFPSLSQGWTLGIEIEANLVDVQGQMLDWELQQIRPLLGAAERERLAVLEEELAELRAIESSAPRTREDLKQRDEQLKEMFRELRVEVDRVAFEIDGLEEVLEGIAVYMRRETDRLSQEERQEVERIRQELRTDLRELEADRRALSRELERTQQAFGARDDSLVEHRELRHDIQDLQAQRAELVDAKAGQMEGAEQALEVAQARRRLPEIKRRLDNYFDQLDRIVAERMDEIQTTLDAERSQLALYQTELDAWNEDTEETVAEIAMWNFLQIEHDFDRLVRRGHVGLVDVDWQQLNDATQNKGRLQDEKRETEDMLREAFPDIH